MKKYVIPLAGTQREVAPSELAEELKECIEGFYRRNASAISSLKVARAIARRTQFAGDIRARNDTKTIHAAALYYIGVWSYVAEDESASLRYIKRYLAFADDNPSLKFPRSLANKHRKLMETLAPDPNFKKLRELARHDPPEALAYIERCERYVGKDVIVDHMYYVFWAVAAFQAGHPRKAYWMSRKAVGLSTRCTMAELVFALVSAAVFSGANRETAKFQLLRLRRRKTTTMLCSPCSVAETKIKRLRRLVDTALRHVTHCSSPLPAALFMPELLRLL